MARAGEAVNSDGSIEWVKLHVGETDQTYCWNRRTRETTWRAPPGVEVLWMGGKRYRGMLWYFDQVTGRTAHAPSAASWLTGYGVRGLASPHTFLGATPLGDKSGAVECGLLPGAVCGGRHGVVWLLLVAGWPTWCWECRLLSGHPSYSEASGAGAHRAPVMDVSVILQLKFLHSYENVEVPQFPFLDRVLQLPVVLQRRVRAVQIVQKPETPPCSSLTIVYVPTVVRGQVPEMVQTVQKIVKFPHAFLDKVVLPVVMQDRGLSRQCRKP